MVLARSLVVVVFTAVVAAACNATPEGGPAVERTGGVPGKGGAATGGATSAGNTGGTTGSGGTTGTGGTTGANTGTGGASPGSGGASGSGGATGTGGANTGAGGTGADAASDGPAAVVDAGGREVRHPILLEGADYPPRPEVRICKKEWSHEECCAFLCRCLDALCSDAPKAKKGVPTCKDWCPKLSNMAMRCHVYHCFESVSMGGSPNHDSHCGHASDQVPGGMCRPVVYEP